jgi:hypothetical protein
MPPVARRELALMLRARASSRLAIPWFCIEMSMANRLRRTAPTGFLGKPFGTVGQPAASTMHGVRVK